MYTAFRLRVLGPSFLAALTGACATTSSPPRELAEAQQEFQKASTGPAAQLNPAGLLQAKKALDRANQEFAEHPNGASTADFAYVALRRAQLAEVQAQTLLAAQEKAEANRQIREMPAQRLARSQRRADQEPPNARQQIGGSGQPQPSTERGARAAQPLDVEENRTAGSDQKKMTGAEWEAQKVRGKLASVAPVRQEPRGIVIAFPDSALFTNGRSTLKPSGKSKLNQVAAALLEGEEKILIEGHTDASGSDRATLGLSERRAITVRNYLRDRGISPDRMTAVGMGGARPRADNASAEGRAKNRRVEIIVEAPAAMSKG